MTTAAATAPAIRRIATYARVSSDDQRDRATIQTQIEQLDLYLARLTGVEVVARYVDDGVSGMIPIARRPAGAQLIKAGASGLVGELLVYDVDRLGRDAPDIMRARRDLAEIGTRIFTPAGEVPPLLFDLQAVIGDYARVQFLKRSADGMARAAREGRHTGGVVSFGFRVEGRKAPARLVPDRDPLTPELDLSAADVIGLVYRWLALEGGTCPQIADTLNAMGIPTSYVRAGREVERRGQRRQRTQAIWRGGHIRNLVMEPIYKGVLGYGRRSRRPREVIFATVESLVSEELWDAAQAALRANRRIARNTERRYLLKGVLTCSLCGLAFVGSQGREGVT
jgi:site-specific DNA recombinase